MRRIKVVSINLGPYGSTGKIMLEIHKMVKHQGSDSKMIIPYSGEELFDSTDYYVLGNAKTKKLNAYSCVLTGLDGCFAWFTTKKLISFLKRQKIDLLHLHNIHYSYINLPQLFRFIKKNNISTIWTLHDCWSFTGHCPHFMYEECNKWQTGCHHCPRYKMYPKSIYDNSKFMWKLKKKWFTGVGNLTIVTPSQWLADLVKQSYLKDYPVRVIHNGINLSIFKPAESNFREKHHIQDKKIVLGVAFGWGERKGLDVFVELSKRLPPDYQIVLVGTDKHIDEQLPQNIISIHRTHNQTELAEIYTAVDVFVNPTREDNFPTVNMEALACATPVITFKTGGSPEMIDETCGISVEKDDVDELEKQILYVCETHPFSSMACTERAKTFDMHDRFAEYIALYKELL